MRLDFNEYDFQKCKRCLYSYKNGKCKKGFKGYNDNCYFESKYIIDDETGKIIYREKFNLE